MASKTAKTSQSKTVDLSGSGKTRNSLGPRANTGTLSAPTTSAPPCCERCEHTCQTKSGLAKHIKNCVEHSEKICGFCKRESKSFQSMRLHQRSAHTEEYLLGEEAKLQSSEASRLMAIAEIEAAFPAKKLSIATIMSKTGLTKEQVRRRRERPEYKEYLALARERQKAKTATSLSAPNKEIDTPDSLPATAPQTTSCSSDKASQDIALLSDNSGSSYESSSDYPNVSPIAGPSKISSKEGPATTDSTNESFSTNPQAAVTYNLEGMGSSFDESGSYLHLADVEVREPINSPQPNNYTLSQNLTSNKRRRSPDSSPEVMETPASRLRLDTHTPRPKHHSTANNITIQRAPDLSLMATAASE